MEARLRSKVLYGAGAIAILLAILIRVLSPLTAPRLAYLYHPGSDELYVATLLPDLGEFKNWRRITPYRAQLFGDFIQIEYRGRLAAVAPRAVPRKGSWQADAALRASDTGDVVEIHIILDPERSRREDVPAAVLLPEAWRDLDRYLQSGSDDLLAVDIVVIKRARGTLLRSEMYPGALFVQGAAADALWRLGYD